MVAHLRTRGTAPPVDATAAAASAPGSAATTANTTRLPQVNQLLEVGDKNQGTRKYTALDKWASQLKSIHTAVQNKMG